MVEFKDVWIIMYIENDCLLRRAFLVVCNHEAHRNLTECGKCELRILLGRYGCAECPFPSDNLAVGICALVGKLYTLTCYYFGRILGEVSHRTDVGVPDFHCLRAYTFIVLLVGIDNGCEFDFGIAFR